MHKKPTLGNPWVRKRTDTILDSPGGIEMKSDCQAVLSGGRGGQETWRPGAGFEARRCSRRERAGD